MNIYVGNLNYRVKESDLQKAMEDYGTVSSVKFINDRTTGRFRGIAFVEMEDGKSGLVFIEDLSVVRIKSPKDRVKIGQEIQCKVKSIDKKTGKVNLSYKDCLGTWEENAQKFSVGMNVKGIIRETEKNKNGVFIEITPNLVGMAEYREGLEYGKTVDVHIKKIDYDKKKIKLVIR